MARRGRGGQQRLRLVPATEVERDLGLLEGHPRALVAELAQLRRAAVEQLVGLARTAGEQQRVGEVDVRPGELVGHPRRAGVGERGAQQLDRAVGVAEHQQADPARVAGVQLGPRRVGGRGGVRGDAAQRLGVAVAAPEHERRRLAREDHRALLGGAVDGQELERLVPRLQRGLAGALAPPGAAEPVQEGGGAHGLALPVDLRERALGELAGAGGLVLAGDRGAVQEVDVVDAEQLLGVRDAVPQLQGALEQVARLAGGVHGGRGLAGAHRRDERARAIAGGVVVVRDHRRGGRLDADLAVEPALERLGDREVQLGLLAGEEVVVPRPRAAARGGTRRVPSCVGEQDVMGDGLAHAVAQDARLEPGDLLEHVEHRPVARRRPSAAARCAASESSSTRSMSASRSEMGRSPRPSPPAARSSSAKSGLPSLRCQRRSRSESVAGRARGSSASSAPSSPRVKRWSSTRRTRSSRSISARSGAQRVAAVQLVGAVGPEQQDALGAEVAGEEGDELAGRAVGPVEVVEDEDDGLVAAEALEQPEQQLEQPPCGRCRPAARSGGRRDAELGQQPRQLATAAAELVEHRVVRARQRAQRADDRGVRQLAVAELEAVAPEDAVAELARPPADGVGEAALADPRLAGDQRDARLPRARRRAVRARAPRARRSVRRTCRS